MLPARLPWIPLCLTTLLALTGCGRLRLPAIDPTGQSIFLPAPNYTTVGPPQAKLRDLDPLFPTPAEPPPCNTASAAPSTRDRDGLLHLGHRPGRASNPLVRRGEPGRLIVAPGRLVAPVGSEVIVTSGLCGPDGYFLTQQPIEWTLSQDSVGNLVDVGGDGKHVFNRVVHDRSQKLSANYAKSYTSQQWELLTRGNHKACDDVLLKKGQSWVSISSPVEGASYLSAMAPEAEAWDHRRQTVEIQWVDAQWTLPAPASVRAGQVHELVTTVVRRSNGTPAENWIVIYEILDGPPAQFAENGQRTVEVKTDGTGRAKATIAPTTQEPGAARIRVHIVRPPAGQSPRFPIAQGLTTVAWSAAGLAIRIQGPEAVIAGAAVRYDIEVANPGDQPARDVTVSAVVPPNLRIVSTAPPARALGERLQWDLGALQGLERRQITVNAELVRPGDILFQVQAQSLDGLQASESWQTRVADSALQVSVDGPRTGFVGGELPFRITVRNTSSALLSNIVVYDTFGAGLRHKEGGVSPLENPRLGNLAPGEAKELQLTFIALSAGQQCHQVRVVADGGQVAEQEACVDVAERGAPLPPGAGSLQVTKTGPPRLALGETQDYFIVITNTGQTVLTNVAVIDRYDPFVQPSEASGQFSVSEGIVRWVVPQLGPGQRANMTVRCTAKEPRPGAFPVNQDRITAINRVLVSSDQGVTGESQATTEVFRTADGSTTIPTAPSAPGQNRLQVTKTGPTRLALGETQDYFIVVNNTSGTTLTNVTVVDRYDSLVVPVMASGQFTIAPGEVRWTIPRLGAGQKAQTTVRCTAKEPTPGAFPAGQQSVTAVNRVQVTSDQGVAGESQAITQVFRTGGGAAGGPPPPGPGAAALLVTKTGPSRMVLGETQNYAIVVTNNTATTLTNVTVVDQYDQFVLPVMASGRFTISAGEVRWVIARLGPGQKAQVTIRCTAKEPTPGAFPAGQERVIAVNRVLVTSTEGPRGESQATTEVFRTGAPSSTIPSTPPAAPPAGGALPGATRVSIASTANPTRVGQQFTLLLVIANDRDTSDQNVRLRVILPPELQFQRATGPAAFRGLQASIVEFEAVREIRPQEVLETVPFRVDVIGLAAGDFRVRAEVFSTRNPQPLVQESTVTVEP